MTEEKKQTASTAQLKLPTSKAATSSVKPVEKQIDTSRRSTTKSSSKTLPKTENNKKRKREADNDLWTDKYKPLDKVSIITQFF